MCARYWRACACLQRRPKVSAENVIILGNGIVLVIQAQAVEWKKLYALYCYIDDIIVPKRNKLCLYIMQMPSGTFAATYTVPYVNGFIDIVDLSEDPFLFIKKKTENVRNCSRFGFRFSQVPLVCPAEALSVI